MLFVKLSSIILKLFLFGVLCPLLNIREECSVVLSARCFFLVDCFRIFTVIYYIIVMFNLRLALNLEIKTKFSTFIYYCWFYIIWNNVSLLLFHRFYYYGWSHLFCLCKVKQVSDSSSLSSSNAFSGSKSRIFWICYFFTYDKGLKTCLSGSYLESLLIY